MVLRALIAAALILPLAPAAMSQDERSQAIHYHEYQVNAEDRRRALIREIRRTARRVCDIHGSYDLATFRMERACREAALQRAMMQLDRRGASYHSGHATNHVSAPAPAPALQHSNLGSSDTRPTRYLRREHLG